MATLGTQVVGTAWQVITAYGGTSEVTYASVGVPTFDPVTGLSSVATTTKTLTIALSNYRRQEVDGVRIVAGDRRVIFPKATLAVIPTTRDYCTITSVRWDVKDVVESGNEALWVLQVRRVGN